MTRIAGCAATRDAGTTRRRDVLALLLDERHERVLGRQPPDRAQAASPTSRADSRASDSQPLRLRESRVVVTDVAAVLEDELEPFSSLGSSKASTATSTTASTTRMIFLRRSAASRAAARRSAHPCVHGTHQGVPPAATAEVEVEESGVVVGRGGRRRRRCRPAVREDVQVDRRGELRQPVFTGAEVHRVDAEEPAGGLARCRRRTRVCVRSRCRNPVIGK